MDSFVCLILLFAAPRCVLFKSLLNMVIKNNGLNLVPTWSPQIYRLTTTPWFISINNNYLMKNSVILSSGKWKHSRQKLNYGQGQSPSLSMKEVNAWSIEFGR